MTTRNKRVPGELAFTAIWTAVIFAVAFLGPYAFGADKSRPMDQMQGGCENFAMPLAKEMSLWDKSEIRVQGAQDDRSTAVLPSDKKVNLSLYPQKKVSLPVKPQKDAAKGEPSFAALAAIDVKSDGVYRVALGSRVWLDLIEAGSGEAAAKIVPADQFEMQTGCNKIFKAVEYSLKAGKKYYLQITASREPAAQVLTSFVK